CLAGRAVLGDCRLAAPHRLDVGFARVAVGPDGNSGHSGATAVASSRIAPALAVPRAQRIESAKVGLRVLPRVALAEMAADHTHSYATENNARRDQCWIGIS